MESIVEGRYEFTFAEWGTSWEDRWRSLSRKITSWTRWWWSIEIRWTIKRISWKRQVDWYKQSRAGNGEMRLLGTSDCNRQNYSDHVNVRGSPDCYCFTSDWYGSLSSRRCLSSGYANTWHWWCQAIPRLLKVWTIRILYHWPTAQETNLRLL